MTKRALALLPLAVLACAGCAQQLGRDTFTTWQLHDDPTGVAETLPLESGQIIVTGSNTRMDLFIGLMPEVYMPYVHAGIIVIEDGEPYVYEELGNPRLFTRDGPPTANVRGGVTRAKLNRFLERYFYVDIYAPDGLDRQAIVAFAKHHFAEKTPFDAHFDYAEHEKFYCTEFVALAMEAGGAENLPLTPNRDNRSARVVLDWLRVPDAVMQATTLAERGVPVARLSRHRTPTEIQLMEALKQELYRRYTCDQKLGNLFKWEGLFLQYREPVEAYMKAGLTVYPAEGPAPGAQAAEAAARDLADEMFGPFDASLAAAPCECAATTCVIPPRYRAELAY